MVSILPLNIVFLTTLAVAVSAGPALADAPRVAVMDFSAASTAAELEPLGVGLQSMITTDLSELPSMSLIERARLKDLQAELKLSQSSLVDKQTAAKLGALAGASHLLVGSFTVVAGKMRIDARMFAVATGDVIFSEKSEGAQAAFFELEKALIRKIVDAVGLKLNKKEKADLQKPKTTSFEAFTQYSQGLAFHDQGKRSEAIAAMRSATVSDPSFVLASTKLAEFQAAMPAAPQTPTSSCQASPLTTPCAPGGAATIPTMVAPFGGDSRRYDIIVRSGGNEARCLGPCALHLPEGRAEVEVLSPVKFKQDVNVASSAGPVGIEVTTRNRTNLIVGATLAAATGAALIATIVLYTYNPTYSPGETIGRSYVEYGPIPLALAAGMVYPAIHFLLRMGKNNVRVR